MKASFQRGDVKECCKQDENLTKSKERPDLTIYTCEVCHCKHYVLHAEVGTLFTKLQEEK